MQTARIKLTTMLQALSSRFSSMTFVYGYDELVKQHIVDVTPVELYSSDEYMGAESDLVEEFVDEFPEEGLLFTSDDPHIRKPQPIFTAHSRVHELASPSIDAEEIYKTLLPSNSIRYGSFEVLTVKETNGHEIDAGEYNYAMAA